MQRKLAWSLKCEQEASLWSYDYDLNFAMLYVDTSDVPEEIMKTIRQLSLTKRLAW